MSIRIVGNHHQRDPFTEPILAYLAEAYGMPASHIKGVTMRADVGDAQVLEVRLYVRKPPQSHTE